MTWRVLLVEDDPLQAEAIKQDLAESFPGLTITRIATESAFRAQLDKIASDPPHLIILDAMLRWADPSPDMEPPPEEVLREKHYRAGLRCASLLSEYPHLRDTPVILHTMLEEEDLEEQQINHGYLRYVGKAKTTDGLINEVERILRSSLD